MTRVDIREIVASEYAKATTARKRGQQMVINATARQRRAIRAMKYLNMEMPEEDKKK